MLAHLKVEDKHNVKELLRYGCEAWFYMKGNRKVVRKILKWLEKKGYATQAVEKIDLSNIEE